MKFLSYTHVRLTQGLYRPSNMHGWVKVIGEVHVHKANSTWTKTFCIERCFLPRLKRTVPDSVVEVRQKPRHWNGIAMLSSGRLGGIVDVEDETGRLSAPLIHGWVQGPLHEFQSQM